MRPAARYAGPMFRAYAFAAALSGFALVAIGAFGAHGVTDLRVKGLIETATHYQFIHTIGVLAALVFWRSWGAPRARFAPGLFFAGVAAFCGSLYALALGAPSWLGMVTPVGGLLFLMGWLVLAWAAPTLRAP